MPFLRHKHGRSFYELFGTGKAKESEKLPLVCLHGGPGGSHFYFLPLKASIKDRRLLLYDQIGTGRSSALPKRFQTIQTLVRDLEHVLEKMKIDRFHLLGTSWGGSLALEYYFRTKGRGVESLILQSPLVSTKSWAKDADRLLKTLSPEDQKTIRYCLEVGATDSRVYQEAEKAYYKHYVYRGKPNVARERYMKRFPNPHGKDVYMNMWGPSEFRATGSLKSFDREQDLRRIKVPTLFIAGQYDEATPQTLSKFAKQIPDGHLEVIKNASHAILSEKPQAMVRVVSKFLKSVETRSQLIETKEAPTGKKPRAKRLTKPKRNG